MTLPALHFPRKMPPGTFMTTQPSHTMTRSHLVLVLSLAAACFLTACKTTEPRGGVGIKPATMPEWAATGEHPDYPADRFLVAYGLARTGKDAAKQAEDGLERMITSWPMTEHAALFENTQFRDIVTGAAGWISVSELGESVRREEAGNGFENVALCAISRDTLRLWAASLLPDAQKELAASAEPPVAGTVLNRLEAWGAYFLKAARVLAMQLMVEGTLDRAAFAKAEVAAGRLWELPGLMRISQSGNGGVAEIRGGVPGELSMFARFRDEVPAGVPIMWRLAPNLRGQVSGDDVFSKVGDARCKVLAVSPSGDDGGQVFATLDLDRVLGRRTGIVLPVWYWSIVLPSTRNAELEFDVSETVEGAAKGAEPLFVPELSKWAKLRGLRIRKPEDPDAGKHYRLKLAGKIEVRSFTENDQAITYVTGQLDLIDTATGNVLYSYFPGIQRKGQPGQSEGGLALGAQQEAAAEAMLEFIGRLTAFLPSPEDAVRPQ